MLVGVRLYVRSPHQGSIIEQQLLTNERDYGIIVLVPTIFQI